MPTPRAPTTDLLYTVKGRGAGTLHSLMNRPFMDPPVLLRIAKIPDNRVEFWGTGSTVLVVRVNHDGYVAIMRTLAEPVLLLEGAETKRTERG